MPTKHRSYKALARTKAEELGHNLAAWRTRHDGDEFTTVCKNCGLEFVLQAMDPSETTSINIHEPIDRKNPHIYDIYGHEITICRVGVRTETHGEFSEEMEQLAAEVDSAADAAVCHDVWMDPICGCARSSDVARDVPCPSHPTTFRMKSTRPLLMRQSVPERVR